MSDFDSKDVENLLMDLKPAAAGLDRDRIMFEAGRQSTPKSMAWPCATGILSVALVLSLMNVPEPRERIVMVREVRVQSADELAASMADSSSYYQIMRRWDDEADTMPGAEPMRPMVKPDDLPDVDDPILQQRIRRQLGKGDM